MTIAVYGAGAVGSFFGGLLARGGRDVRFIARGEQLLALRTTGLRISSLPLGDIHLPQVSADQRAGPPPADVVLVCVKTHQLAGVLDDLEALSHPETLFVPLLNGIEADGVLAKRFGGERVASVLVYVGASIETPGVVRHAAGGLLMIGSRHGMPAERLEAIRTALTVDGFGVKVRSDIEYQLWYKLMWNTAFNGVSALTLRTSRGLLSVPPTRQLVIDVMREVAAVARAEGVDLTDQHVEQSVTETERIAPIRTSMLVDREKGRQLETDALVGVVVRKGETRGVPTPATSVLHALLSASQPASQ